MKVDLRPSYLINEEITIKDTLFNEVVTGMAVYFSGDNDIIQFKQNGTALVSDALFEFELRLIGPMLIDMDYKNYKH